jgi:hypothetical protein
MGIHEFDNVTVVHGRVAAIIEVLDNSHFLRLLVSVQVIGIQFRFS